MMRDYPVLRSLRYSYQFDIARKLDVFYVDCWYAPDWCRSVAAAEFCQPCPPTALYTITQKIRQDIGDQCLRAVTGLHSGVY